MLNATLPQRRWLRRRRLAGAGLLALGALLFAACSRDEVTIGQSPLLRFVERKSGRIAVMSTDGNIYTMDQAGGRRLSREPIPSKSTIWSKAKRCAGVGSRSRP